MAILLPNGLQSYQATTGAPLSGGKVYTYAAGTNTPKATYTTAAESVANANPVILNARGEASIFWSGAYKIVLTDASDVIIWTQDNISTVSPDLTALAVRVTALESEVDAIQVAAPISVSSYGASNDLAQINAALAASIRTGGRGATINFPAGVWTPSGPIDLTPYPRIKLKGQGSLSTIINPTHNGPTFVIDGESDIEISGMRIGMSVGSSQIGIDILATASSVFRFKSTDMQIAGNSAAGQIGIRCIPTGVNIITDSLFSDIDFISVDKPIVDFNTEGNFWDGIKVNQFGFSACSATASVATNVMTVTAVASGALSQGQVITGVNVASGTMIIVQLTGATGGIGTYQVSVFQTAAAATVTAASCGIASQGLVNKYEARVAGAVLANTVGMAFSGVRSYGSLVVDIGAAGFAINTAANSFLSLNLERPELLTPLGIVGINNSISDSQNLIVTRSVRNGSPPTAANFTLAGWGNTATVTGISGNDQAVRFTISSLGVGQAANPTVTYTYADGAFSVLPKILMVQRRTGNQLTVPVFNQNANTSDFNFQWLSTPVAGEAYEFIAALI